MDVRRKALNIGRSAVADMIPDKAVRDSLSDFRPSGRLILVAIGKAAWRMAHAAWDTLGDRIEGGIVITKDGHAEGAIGPLMIREASHPVVDERALSATEEALSLVAGLDANDTVLFLVSGGGSALFEKPVEGVSLGDLQEISSHLMNAGGDIVTLNAVRKRLSRVKGGKFAHVAAPARIEALILSDVLGDRLDSIASGPAAADSVTNAQVRETVRRFGLSDNPVIQRALTEETPKSVENVTSRIIGSVSVLCARTVELLGEAGIPSILLTTRLSGEAREVGQLMAEIAVEIRDSGRPASPPCAIIAGGETIVHVRGNGLGGRNQEMALGAALGIAGLENVAFLALASDGTDGPTDAAGGIVDGGTIERIRSAGIDPLDLLHNNDAYHALDSAGDLVRIGPTGTNVNDIAVLLVG